MRTDRVPRKGTDDHASSSRRRLADFTGAGYDKGRGAAWQVAWIFVSGAVVQRWWCPPSLRVGLLRAFGAQIGEGVLVRHRVRIHWPWKLRIGDSSWIGEGVWILNLEDVRIGADVCVSQDVLLCTGSHSAVSPTFEFDNAPIVVEDGAWIAARAVVLRGVTVGTDSVVGATALVVKDVPPGARVLAPPAVPAP
jgi:putative colanic acid biosynthesis acetyltransferase WcaF